MHTKITKMEIVLYNKLEKIDSDVNSAIRKLLNTIHNEAEKIYAQKLIKYHEDLILKNEEEIKLIPDREIEYWNRVWNELTTKKSQMEMDKKIFSLKVAKPRVLHANYEYEAEPEYVNLVVNSNKLAMEHVSREFDKLQIELDKFDETKKRVNVFQEKKDELTLQNERAKKEIERMNKILEIGKLLEV